MKRYVRTKDGKIYEIDEHNNCLNFEGWYLTDNGKTIRYDILYKEVVAESNNIEDLLQVGDLCRVKFNSDDFAYTNGTIRLDEVTEEELFDIQLGIEDGVLILLEVYTKQGNNYILVYDKDKGVI